MPGPSFEPAAEWSTDTNYPAGADPWNGNATRVAPSAGQHSAGLEPGDTLPAPWWNYFIGRLTAWVAYLRGFVNEVTDELIYPNPLARTLILSPSAFEQSISATWEAPGGVFTTGARGSLVDGAVLVADLSKIIPAGCTLSSVEVLLNPGAARTGGDRVAVDILEQTPNFAVPAAYGTGTSLGTAYDDGSSSTQLVTLAAVDEMLVSTNTLQLHIYSGQDAGAHAQDVIYAVRLSILETSPSNFGAT